MAASFDLESLRKRIREGRATPRSGENLPVAAVAIIINPRDDAGSGLFIKRQEREGDPWSGQIAFPGGHKSPEDRDLLETAVRETREEVGIELKEHRLIGHLPQVSPRTRRIHVVPYVFELATNARVRMSKEVSESFWVPLNLLEKVRATRTQVHLDQGTLEVDAYIFDGHVIWGLTFRIINILLARTQRLTSS